MRESGFDPTDAASLTRDRKEWKAKVNKRMEHLKNWEASKGNRWSGAVVLRNQVGVNAQVFDCRECGRVCKSKAGLVNHRRRTHEESAAKKSFECDKCKRSFKKVSELKNHDKVCGGAVASSSDRVMCVCRKEYSKNYFRRHRRDCAEWQRQQQPPAAAAPPAAAPPAAPAAAPPAAPAAAPPAAPAARRGPCPDCGKLMRKDNIARHQREACPGSVAGP